MNKERSLILLKIELNKPSNLQYKSNFSLL